MKNLLWWAGAIALALMPSLAAAQSTAPVGRQIYAPAGYLPAQAIYCDDGTGHAGICVFAGKQESFQLMTADVAVLSATLFGGDYAFSQTCTTYGTLNLQVLGPDGATWQTLASKTASDTAGATGFSLGSYATVRVTTSGASGCNAILARIPA